MIFPIADLVSTSTFAEWRTDAPHCYLTPGAPNVLAGAQWRR
ncbi:hypothetical protein [Lentzea indica]|nr:hypothetical protein [Lentzea indica]